MKEVTEAEFVEWLKTKDPVGTFDYGDTRHCCFAMFLVETGRTSEPRVSSFYFYSSDDSEERDIPVRVAWALVNASLKLQPTFGGVLGRLEHDGVA